MHTSIGPHNSKLTYERSLSRNAQVEFEGDVRQVIGMDALQESVIAA
jgi:hypothetical protein